jgi:hypothetical protein
MLGAHPFLLPASQPRPRTSSLLCSFRTNLTSILPRRTAAHPSIEVFLASSPGSSLKYLDPMKVPPSASIIRPAATNETMRLILAPPPHVPGNPSSCSIAENYGTSLRPPTSSRMVETSMFFVGCFPLPRHRLSGREGRTLCQVANLWRIRVCQVTIFWERCVHRSRPRVTCTTHVVANWWGAAGRRWCRRANG